MMGLNSLHVAARCNDEVAMEMLLDGGGDVEIQDNNNNTILSWTTSYKVRRLLLVQISCSCSNTDTLYDIKHHIVVLCGL